ACSPQRYWLRLLSKVGHCRVSGRYDEWSVPEFSRRKFVSTLTGAAGTKLASALPPRPRLFILLIAEQFRSDYLTRFSDLLVPGGFRRLMEEGSYWPDCRMNASSFSAAGLATVATGAYPQAHGIVAESWLDTKSGKVVPASAEACQAGTLAEEIARADTRNRVFGMGADPLRANLAIRGRPDEQFHPIILALSGNESAEPGWVAAFRRAHPRERLKNAKWQGLLAENGAPPMRTLTDDPAHPDEFEALYHSSPFAQNELFELLRAALVEEKLGQGPALDFVSVVFSPMSRLGYEVGADSPLMREMALHFDRQLELTLETLRRLPGGGNFALAFASAHGSPRHKVKPVDGAPIAKAVDHAMAAAYDVSSVKGRWVARYVYPFLYMNHSQLQRYGIDPRQARRLAGDAAIRSSQSVAAYYTADGD